MPEAFFLGCEIKNNRNPKINTKNKNVINVFLSNLHYVKTVNVGQLGLFKKHQKKAKEILNL